MIFGFNNKVIQRINSTIIKYKTVIYNLSYLSLFQILLIVLPLIIYPYLLRVLGADLYGLIIFAQAITLYFSMLINFGFNITATKDIAENVGDLNKLSGIVSSVLIIKFFLWIFSLLILIVLLYFSVLEGDWRLYIFTYLITFNEFLFPQWFFQGIEKMKYITIINLIIKTFFTILIFLLVKNKQDYLYVPLLNGIGALFGGLIAMYVIIYKEKVKFIKQEYYLIKSQFKSSLVIFVSVASKQIYVNANKIIIGTLLGMSYTAFYDLGEKVLRVLKIPAAMFTQATFPLLAKEKNIKLINKTMFIASGVTLILVILVLIFSDQIIQLIGDREMVEAKYAMRVLSVAAIIVAFNQFLGTSRLIVFGYNKLFTKIISSTTIFYCTGAFLLYWLNFVSLKSMSWLAVFVELWVFFLMIYSNHKKNLLGFNFKNKSNCI